MAEQTHCFLRSATAVLAYLMTREHLTFQQALIDLIRCRKFVQPNLGFCNQLMGLEGSEGDLSKYKGPKNYLQNDDEWMRMLDHARDDAGVQGSGFRP